MDAALATTAAISPLWDISIASSMGKPGMITDHSVSIAERLAIDHQHQVPVVKTFGPTGPLGGSFELWSKAFSAPCPQSSTPSYPAYTSHKAAPPSMPASACLSIISEV